MTNRLHKIGFVCIVFFICVFALANCSNRSDFMNYREKPQKNEDNLIYSGTRAQAMLLCWFVIDDGFGDHGFTYIDMSWSRPMSSRGPFFPTMKMMQEVLQKRYGLDPIIYSRPPDWVPEGWKVRNLTSNEVDELRK